MNYTLFLSSKAEKQIKTLPKDVRERIQESLLQLAEDPYRKGIINVKGTDNIKRLRVGKYRVLYLVLEEKKEILVVKVEKREESTYKKL